MSTFSYMSDDMTFGKNSIIQEFVNKLVQDDLTSYVKQMNPKKQGETNKPTPQRIQSRSVPPDMVVTKHGSQMPTWYRSTASWLSNERIHGTAHKLESELSQLSVCKPPKQKERDDIAGECVDLENEVLALKARRRELEREKRVFSRQETVEMVTNRRNHDQSQLVSTKFDFLLQDVHQRHVNRPQALRTTHVDLDFARLESERQKRAKEELERNKDVDSIMKRATLNTEQDRVHRYKMTAQQMEGQLDEMRKLVEAEKAKLESERHKFGEEVNAQKKEMAQNKEETDRVKVNRQKVAAHETSVQLVEMGNKELNAKEHELQKERERLNEEHRKLEEMKHKLERERQLTAKQHDEMIQNVVKLEKLNRDIRFLEDRTPVVCKLDEIQKLLDTEKAKQTMLEAQFERQKSGQCDMLCDDRMVKRDLKGERLYGMESQYQS